MSDPIQPIREPMASLAYATCQCQWCREVRELLAALAAAERPSNPAEHELRALIAKWRREAADEQRVSFCADELEAALPSRRQE